MMNSWYHEWDKEINLCYMCNPCLSPLTSWIRLSFRWGVLDTTLCDTVCHWLAAGRWFYSVSPTYKTDSHIKAEITLTDAHIRQPEHPWWIHDTMSETRKSTYDTMCETIWSIYSKMSETRRSIYDILSDTRCLDYDIMCETRLSIYEQWERQYDQFMIFWVRP
jgi:hypothetical protein